MLQKQQAEELAKACERAEELKAEFKEQFLEVLTRVLESKGKPINNPERKYIEWTVERGQVEAEWDDCFWGDWTHESTQFPLECLYSEEALVKYEQKNKSNLLEEENKKKDRQRKEDERKFEQLKKKLGK